MPSGLIFDLDGTLVDSLRGIAQSLNNALEAHDRQLHGVDAVRRFIGNGSRELIRRATEGGATEEEVDAIEADFKVHYAALWKEGTDIYPGIPALLAKLAAAGHRLGVLSNKPHGFTLEIVAGLFPEIAFDVVLGQRSDVARKPDPAGALEIAEAFSLTPGDCYMIGDSTIDLETGRRAGMETIAVGWGYHDLDVLLAAGADSLAYSTTELGRLLGV